jgi:predicted ATPase/DNA-binding CsgD family transcriptional regulator
MTGMQTSDVSLREAEVLAALGEHLTNAEIAARLHISIRTVESHVSSLLRKFDVGDRRALAAVAGDYVQSETLRAEAPRPVAPGTVVGAPTTLTSFVGRGAERAAVIAALDQAALVTLIGPGGVGKTRLALSVAEAVAPAYPGGATFVDLVPVSAEFVVQSVACELGIIERPNEPLEHLVHTYLRGPASLLVLDNCEHVVDAVAAFTARIGASCPDVTLLVTSRERLGVPGERLFTVPPLSLDRSDAERSEAEALFLDRVQAADGAGFDPGAVAAVCARLDGMPLALELAAARSASLGTDGLLAGLDDHLRLLTGGRSADERHRSLRTVIDWSHELLDADERAVFRRLGVFMTGFDLDAAVAVAAGDGIPPGAIPDLVGRLTDKSLIVHRPPRSTGRSVSSWRLLETVRAFSLERLAESGEDDTVRARHRAWATTAAAALEQRVAHGDDDEWFDDFQTIADDLRGAFADAPDGPDPETYRLAWSLGHVAYACRFLLESQHHFEHAVRHGDAAERVAAMQSAADIAFARMRADESYELLLEASQLARDAGDPDAEAIALARAVVLARRAAGEFPEQVPAEELEQHLTRAQGLVADDDSGARTHVTLAEAWFFGHGPVRADTVLSRAGVAAARALGDPVLMTGALDALCSAYLTTERFRDAAQVAWERVALLPELPDHDPRTGGELIDILHMAMETSVGTGDLERALDAARRTEDHGVSQGTLHLATSRLVIPLALIGDFDAAIAGAIEMRDGWERTGRPTAAWMSPAGYAAAMVHGLRGDLAAFDDWCELGRLLAPERLAAHGFAPFARSRVALHLGMAAVGEARVAGPERDNAMFCQYYYPYARSVAAELAVVLGRPDAEDRLEACTGIAGENDWAAACVLRARGRLDGDRDALQAAYEGFATIGARFEVATTGVLLGGDQAAGGIEVLEKLGCPPPA